MKFISIKTRKVSVILLLFISSIGYSQNNTVEFSVKGLKVILKETQKETLVMSMYFRGGSSNYSLSNAGIESLALSGLIECGAGKYSSNDYNGLVDEYGLHLSGEATNDYGVVKLGCISRYKDEAWKLFSSAIASPLFETQKFNLLKQQKINVLRVEQSSPDERLKHVAQEFAFAGTSYSINPDGTDASLQSLGRDAVKDYYYNTLLNKNRMFLVVAGNISRKDLENKILTAFAEIPAKPYTPANIENPFFTKDNLKIESRQLATNYVAGILNAPSLPSSEYPAFRLGVTILHSALYEVIRLSKQLSYAPSASMSEGRISYVTMYASTTQPEETVKAMRLILSYMKNTTYSETLIRNVIKGYLLSYARRQEVMSDIVDQLGNAEIMGDWKLAENLASRMSVVTAEEIRKVLNVYANSVAWAYIGNAELGQKTFK